jgi:secreted PhoX family phosphatase
MSFTRREFFRQAAIVSTGFMSLRALDRAVAASGGKIAPAEGFGPLQSDPDGVMDLPKGFEYRIISRTGQPMSDGFRVPGKPDGMAAFPGPNGTVRVIRNQEVNLGPPPLGPFGENNEKLAQFNQSKLFDTMSDPHPPLGGVTRLTYDPKTQKVTDQHLALIGTMRNCAGGPTPWGSWITCEESTVDTDEGFAVNHGYNFEIPASQSGLVEPRPIRDMGRFNHEAVAVEPETGIVYQTEDRNDGALYRYIPNDPGNLHKGGRLQALKVREQPSLDTRNWEDQTIKTGQKLAVEWIDLEEIEAPQDDLRHRAYDAGAARFARGEGMWYGKDAIYFACTSGGQAREGQIWRYVPSRFEGTADEAKAPGQLELFVEPDDHEVINNADNLTVAPWGDLLVCEDCSEPSDIDGITPEGKVYKLARNVLSDSELAGVCMSPDGSTLFVNIQHDGLTLAITGDWNRRRG